jgi:uncharacterized protein DUF2877
MTDCFRAVSVGCAVPLPCFESAVHSVFRNAVNLQVPEESILLTLLRSEEADLPQGIRFDAQGKPAFDGLSPGARATCADGVLAVGESLIIDLRAASTWECDLTSLAVDMREPAVASAWQHAWQALRERRAHSESELVAGDCPGETSLHRSVLAQQIDAALCAIVTATSNYDTTGLAELETLIGLGTGLTPSGDDLLTGYLAGLWCTSRQMPRRRVFLAAVAQLVIEYSVLTNDIARTYLALAARGQVSSRLVDVARAIGGGSGAGTVAARTNAAMRVGHSSGMETVNGLLLGLAVWDKPEFVLQKA